MFASETVFIQVRDPLLIKGQRINSWARRPFWGLIRGFWPRLPPRRRSSEVRVVNYLKRNRKWLRTHTLPNEESLQLHSNYSGTRSQRSAREKKNPFIISAPRGNELFYNYGVKCKNDGLNDATFSAASKSKVHAVMTSPASTASPSGSDWRIRGFLKSRYPT